MILNAEEFETIVKALLPATKGKNTSAQTERILFKDDWNYWRYK